MSDSSGYKLIVYKLLFTVLLHTLVLVASYNSEYIKYNPLIHILTREFYISREH